MRGFTSSLSHEQIKDIVTHQLSMSQVPKYLSTKSMQRVILPTPRLTYCKTENLRMGNFCNQNCWETVNGAKFSSQVILISMMFKIDMVQLSAGCMLKRPLTVRYANNFGVTVTVFFDILVHPGLWEVEHLTAADSSMKLQFSNLTQQ